MKGLILSLTMILSLPSFAGTRKEYDENTERQCHQELKKVGCVKAEAESKACAELNKAKLSPVCRELHDAQKNQILN